MSNFFSLGSSRLPTGRAAFSAAEWADYGGGGEAFVIAITPLPPCTPPVRSRVRGDTRSASAARVKKPNRRDWFRRRADVAVRGLRRLNCPIPALPEVVPERQGLDVKRLCGARL